jgi:hypothetical protein
MTWYSVRRPVDTTLASACDCFPSHIRESLCRKERGGAATGYRRENRKSSFRCPIHRYNASPMEEIRFASILTNFHPKGELDQTDKPNMISRFPRHPLLINSLPSLEYPNCSKAEDRSVAPVDVRRGCMLLLSGWWYRA